MRLDIALFLALAGAALELVEEVGAGSERFIEGLIESLVEVAERPTNGRRHVVAVNHVRVPVRVVVGFHRRVL
jgi:hypothetical protein